MADEAFALSPISARPAVPSEADYDAIREAFMESSRGRWFLGEYAKRNRNADTAMVLDAVTRIEQALAAQRQERARKESLGEALAAVRGAVDQASEAASAAFARLQLEENLAPIHKGTRIIKEISWRWREIGADGRICDMIDSQLAAIEASCGRIAGADGSAALSAAFDLLKRKLDELCEIDEAPTTADAAPAVAQPAAAVAEQSAAATEQPTTTDLVVEAPPPAAGCAEPAVAGADTTSAIAKDAIVEGAIVDDAIVDDAIVDAPTVQPDVPVKAEAVAIESPETSREAADAQDEAILELIAIEMAAPDPIDDATAEKTAEPEAMRPAAVEPVTASAARPAPALPPAAQIAPLTVRKFPEPLTSPGGEPSLGSTIIATGILQRSKMPSDPLAPIRRMSQVEKIAFFS